jgi:hypothetical protein
MLTALFGPTRWSTSTKSRYIVSLSLYSGILSMSLSLSSAILLLQRADSSGILSLSLSLSSGILSLSLSSSFKGRSLHTCINTYIRMRNNTGMDCLAQEVIQFADVLCQMSDMIKHTYIHTYIHTYVCVTTQEWTASHRKSSSLRMFSAKCPI